jgi:hypothetical protein
MAPLIWSLGSPFDHGPRSFARLLFTLPIAYLIGVLPALATGAAYRFMHARAVRPGRMRLGVVLIGAGSSTYLVWIGLTAELLDGKFSVEVLLAAVFFLIPGTVATLVLLALETLLARRG